MTNAELIQKIRAEIERQEKQCPLDTYEGRHRLFILVSLKTFLSTLESGSSETPKDLEEAKEAYCEEHNDECFDAIGSKCPHIRNAFIAGAKWQEEQDKGTIELAEDHAFLAGADWQKEQMLKEAVEGEVVKDINNKLAVTAKNVNLDKFKFGDKVRIIIVKEDEE